MFFSKKILTVGLFFSCSYTALADSGLKEDLSILTGYKLALQGLNESDLSCLSDTDCTSIAVGSKACGGPQDYLVMSHNNSYKRAILKIAEYMTSRERGINKRYGLASDWMVMMKPKVTCQQYRCKAL